MRCLQTSLERFLRIENIGRPEGPPRSAGQGLGPGRRPEGIAGTGGARRERRREGRRPGGRGVAGLRGLNGRGRLLARA